MPTMPMLPDGMFSRVTIALLEDAALKGSVLLLCCAVAVLLMRRASAATRHLVWTLGVIGALLMPALMYVLPAWRIGLPLPALFPSSAVTGAVQVALEPASPADAALSVAVLDRAGAAPDLPDRQTARPPDRDQVVVQLGAASQAVLNPPIEIAAALSEPAKQRDWRPIAVMIWLAGVVLSLTTLLVSFTRVRKLQRGSVAVETGPCVDAVERVAARVGLARVPRVHVGGDRTMPMVWGLLRPVLLLPTGAARWTPAKLESVLLHELAHVRRRDPLTQFIAEIARAIYWFNPLVWLAARRLYIEREHACDDIVLNAGTRASDYAGELLDLVRSLRTTRATAMAAIAMARPSQLKVRLSAVLDDARSRSGLSRRALASASGGALLLILPLAALRPSETAADIPTLQLDLGRAQRQVDAAGMPKVDRRSPATRPRLRMRAPEPEAAIASAPVLSVDAPGHAVTVIPSGPAMAGPRAAHAVLVLQDRNQATCWSADRRNTSMSNHIDTDEDLHVVKWSSGRCSGSLRMEGKVRLSGDFSGISSIASGGSFRIEEDDGDTDRRLVIRPANGQLVYSYRVDGRDRDFDAAGRAWLESALLNLFRTTGFAADERVDYLLRAQGPSGVLAEVDHMRSDYVQRIYMQRLLERSDLSPALVKQAVELAAREIESDYELAQLLIAFSKKYDLSDDTRALFINATNSISSDYEQRRVLSSALGNTQLRSQDVSAMLDASHNISSDYERAQLLLGLIGKYKLDPNMRASYLTAASEISSDYEKGRVYKALIKQGNLTSADIAHVLKYAGSMSSDYEKAQLLITMNEFDLSDAMLQRAYLEASSRISSDYEHRRVLSGLVTKEKLTAANLDLALRSATGIDSDYELAQLLLQVLKNHTLTEQQRPVFMKALNSISSSHEFGRVAAALLRATN
jgi:beta-lactamase regulating signal transducer with metallopeptidase domain